MLQELEFEMMLAAPVPPPLLSSLCPPEFIRVLEAALSPDIIANPPEY
jgi:hypothetical protein